MNEMELALRVISELNGNEVKSQSLEWIVSSNILENVGVMDILRYDLIS